MLSGSWLICWCLKNMFSYAVGRLKTGWGGGARWKRPPRQFLVDGLYTLRRDVRTASRVGSVVCGTNAVVDKHGRTNFNQSSSSEVGQSEPFVLSIFARLSKSKLFASFLVVMFLLLILIIKIKINKYFKNVSIKYTIF